VTIVSSRLSFSGASSPSAVNLPLDVLPGGHLIALSNPVAPRRSMLDHAGELHRLGARSTHI